MGLTMRGLAVRHPMKSPQLQGPVIRPKRKKEERRVFLEPELWTALTRAATFHEKVFGELHRLKGLKADDAQKLSRNDIIEGFLEWALAEYWNDKGGEPPEAASEYAEKVRAFAKRMLADEQKNHD